MYAEQAKRSGFRNDFIIITYTDFFQKYQKSSDFVMISRNYMNTKVMMTNCCEILTNSFWKFETCSTFFRKSRDIWFT